MPIRSATPEDVHAIAAIHVRSWQAAYRGLLPDDLLARQSVERREAHWRDAVAREDGAVLVAEEDGRTVGFASVAATRDLDADPATTGEVYAIYLDPDAYGRGLGRALMDGAVEELGRRGFRLATLWVLASNERARRFYARAGWRPDGGTKIDQFGDVDVLEVRYARDIESNRP
jgi:ribosomal protein S18 acetylase RimI-like enzyme